VALGINGSGQVVGQADPTNGAPAAFLWTPSAPSGTMIDLGTLGGTESLALGNPGSAAFGINGSGQVVGYSVTTSGAQAAFLWTPATPNGTSGTMAALPTLSGATAVSAYGINDSGQVVGTTGSAAFLYSGGKVIDLGSLAGSSGTIVADAINAGGQVVGSSDMRSGPPHAFLWTPTTPNGTTGTMVDLNTLISASKVTLEGASGINDQGQIVGTGLFNNNMHAFLLTPAPTGTHKARLASSTPPGTIAGPTSVTGTDTSVAPVLALPPAGSSFGLTGAAVSLWLSQPAAAPAGAASPAVPVAEAPPFAPPPTGIRPPADQADSFQPAVAPEAAAAADPVVAGLDAEASWAPFVEDLALTGRRSEGRTPAPAQCQPADQPQRRSPGRTSGRRGPAAAPSSRRPSAQSARRETTASPTADRREWECHHGSGVPCGMVSVVPRPGRSEPQARRGPGRTPAGLSVLPLAIGDGV
jgi:probable HAF family extracellular repeat protein